jgi:hypothetical protein
MTPNLLSSFCRLTQNQQFPERQEVRARYVYSFISYILARLSHAHNLGAVWSTLKNIVFTFLNRQMPIPKTSGSRSFKIFIGGVAQGTTEDDLKNFFQTFGPVSNLLMTTYNSSWLHYSYKRWRWYPSHLPILAMYWVVYFIQKVADVSLMKDVKTGRMRGELYFVVVSTVSNKV